MDQVMAQQTGGDPDLLDTTGLCLLSLDGGGVRGLSSLYILKSIMDRLNYDRERKVKPCEIFDLIGGTSTGGLIAIMLGRLEMSVDECIDAYSELAETVFGVRLSRLPFNLRARIEPLFDSKKLQGAVEQVLKKRNLSKDALFEDGNERGCRTFVCCIDYSSNHVVRLRSYKVPHEQDTPATICQAALATTAAPTFFSPGEIDDRKFVDGGLGANNPVDEVEGEASDIWCPQTGDLKPLVKCFISIGTGNPGQEPFKENILKFLSQTIVKVATQTEKTARTFLGRWIGHYDQNRYFRFNVQQGLQAVGLHEFKKKGVIKSASHAYLTDKEQVVRVRYCVQNLGSKENQTDISFGATFQDQTTRIAQQQLQEKAARRTVYDVPSDAVSSFSGREKILEQIDNAFSKVADATKTRKPPVFVLQAMGGQGKSQIALQYCQNSRSRSRYQITFWIDADSEAAVQRGFKRMAKKLNPSAAAGPDGQDDTIDLVKEMLADIEQEWLLVFDNYDDISSFELQPYLPTNGRGCILLTSRDGRTCDFAEPGIDNFFSVPSMEHDGGLDLLRRRLGSYSTNDEADRERHELLQRLGGLALAIDQAAAYISFHKMTISDFLKKYESRKEEILKHHRGPTWKYNKLQDNSNDKIHLTAYTTWEMSFEQIEPNDEKRKEWINCFLSISAFLQPLRIGEHIFREVYTSESDLPDWFNMFTEISSQESGSDVQETRPVWNGAQFHKVIRHLEQLSLVSNTGKYSEDIGVWFSVHPVIRDWLQIRMESSLRQETFKDSIWLIETVVLLEVTRIAGLDVNQELLNHVDILSDPLLASYKDGLLDDTSVSDNATAFGRFYLRRGQTRKAVEVLGDVLDTMRDNLTADHLGLDLQHTLARAYRYDQQILKAIELLDHVIEVENLEETHPKRLASQHELAVAYKNNGQTEDAIKLLEHVVNIQEASPAETHAVRLASQHELAIAYRQNAQLENAIKLLEHVVNIQEASLAETHPSRLSSQHELAMAYRDNGQVEDAIKLLEHVVEIEANSAEDQPNRLGSRHQLAVAYRDSGQVEDAIKMLEPVVKIREDNLAEHHPSLLLSQHSLAVAYLIDGQARRGIELLEQVVRVWQQHNQNHLDCHAAQRDLDEAYRWRSQETSALPSERLTDDETTRSRPASVSDQQRNRRVHQEDQELGPSS